MPTYQYACTTCGEDLEVVQSFSDDPLTDCPACDDGTLRKLFGNVGVVFKGSGFYRTDSRADGRKRGGASAPATKEKAASAAPASSTDSSGGSAPAGGSAASSAPAKAPAAASS